jgi:hypothetical protein
VARLSFEVFLVNARGTKNLPVRKTDVQECDWLRKLHVYVLLKNSFHPPEEIRAIRTIWRQRDRWVREAGRAIQQMQKAITTIDGIDVMIAQVIFSEIGPDFSAFPTENHFASWLTLAPKRDISGGKVIRHIPAAGRNKVANALRMAAQSLSGEIHFSRTNESAIA